MAIAWLEEHPEDLDASSREVAGRIGVSHSYVSKAQREMRRRRAG